ncbi:MAG: S41 family peptidase [Puia sp.]|nr:S41 family peptidase [Puia sp.]
MLRSLAFLLAIPLLLSSVISTAYGHDLPRPRNAVPPPDSLKLACLEKASRLLDEALVFMQKNYYKRENISWDTLGVMARTRLKNSANCDDAYATITWCFQQINESHSFIMPAEKAAVYNNDNNNDAASTPVKPDLSQLVGEIKGEVLSDSIAYLTVPWVSTTDSMICMQIADSIQQLIADLDTRKISKWIIDLRANTGGNCWPMLAGIGPLLGNGTCGYFVSDNEKIPIAYRDGAAFQGKHIRCQVSKCYRIKSGRKSIVVLTGHRTVSAGEIVALAFKGKTAVHLYGEPTAGMTTANATYTLSDHSMLVLTVCREADFTGTICEGSIVPDKIINPNAGDKDDDITKLEALRWLQM